MDSKSLFCIWSPFQLLTTSHTLSLVVVREVTDWFAFAGKYWTGSAINFATDFITASASKQFQNYINRYHQVMMIRHNHQREGAGAKFLFQVNTGAIHWTAAPYFWTSQRWSRQLGRCWRSAPAPAWNGWEALIFLPDIRWNCKILCSRPELSSPTTNTFASFFLKPSTETNLSRNPMRRTMMSTQSLSDLADFYRKDGAISGRCSSLLSWSEAVCNTTWWWWLLWGTHVDFQDTQYLLSIQRFYDQYILFDHQLAALYDQY